MAHRFPIKDIAHQAGIGTATVDRVLNGRGNVRRQMINRVMNAIRELEAQEAQLSMTGRKMMLDLIVEAPQAFLNALQVAVAQELPVIQSAIFRVRSDTRARFAIEDIIAALDRAVRLKSDGVILMAPDTPRIRQAVRRVTDVGIAVVTLATDMPTTPRTAYVGLDNLRAGETAAWLIGKWCTGNGSVRVLMTKRNIAFRGEAEREEGFRRAMARLMPGGTIGLLVQGEQGPDFARRVVQSVADTPVSALYSIGGGNRNLIAALDSAGLAVPVVIVHDIDDENRELLAAGRIDAVIYHDLAEDIRHACQTFMSVHSKGLIPRPPNGATLRVMLPPMLFQGPTQQDSRP